MKKLRVFSSLLSVAVLLLSSMSLVTPLKADALSGGEFQAGRIIDDVVFFNGSTLGVTQIQQFLNAKVPVCDTNGTQPYAGTTRAAYGASKGYPAPFTCLKDYRQDTVAKSADGLCNGYGVANQTAAEIIYNVGVSCGVSQKVLLVLLEKEQSLVSDDWPWSVQYRSATGYGCPDTAPCDAEYYGFFNQVYAAARQFKRYARDSNLFNYSSQSNSYVLYNPNSSCGGSNVFIQNQATAGLYNYTPYQPNSAALNNLYGNGDVCSAYGNRNFWRLYNDWFGTTMGCYYARGEDVPPSLPYNKSSAMALPGNWTGPGKQGLAYVTPYPGGFSVAVMASTGTTLQWKGIWWDQNNARITLDNTVFVPADVDGDGYTDLLYATSQNPNQPGFGMGLMRNTGSGFVYAGTKWAPDNISLNATKFIPGKWTAGAAEGFAYATPYAGGFSVAVMASTGSTLQWKGIWWDQRNAAISLSNTALVPADGDGDGYTDLYYATALNWAQPGFGMGMMRNTASSLAYNGTKWAPTNLSMIDTRFIPGNWSGTGSQGIAYTVACGTKGFGLGIMKGTTGGDLLWQGTKWDASTLNYRSTVFVPADADGDNYTDLFYATTQNPNQPGFGMGLQHTNHDLSLTWAGTVWTQPYLNLRDTLIVP